MCSCHPHIPRRVSVMTAACSTPPRAAAIASRAASALSNTPALRPSSRWLLPTTRHATHSPSSCPAWSARPLPGHGGVRWPRIWYPSTKKNRGRTTPHELIGQWGHHTCPAFTSDGLGTNVTHPVREHQVTPAGKDSRTTTSTVHQVVVGRSRRGGPRPARRA